MSKNSEFNRLYDVLDRMNVVNSGNNKAEDKPELSDQFAAYILWLDSEPMIPERTYSIHFQNDSTIVQVTDLSFKINIKTLSQLAAKKLEQDEVGYCKLSLSQRVSFDAYSDNQQTGTFTIFDTTNNSQIGAGVIDFALRRAQNISWHETNINQETRSKNKHQKPCVLWFTGLSGSGKSTIADELEKQLYELGKHTMLLDGDNVRHGLCRDLGMSDADRRENIRRVGEVAKLMADAGLIVICALISPFREDRDDVRRLLQADQFVEVHVATPIEVCEQRDPKGLYKRARQGEIKDFTGLDSPYEAPQHPELVLGLHDEPLESAVARLSALLRT